MARYDYGGYKMAWTREYRDAYIISKWHILEKIRENGQMSSDEILEYFCLDRRELRTRIDRLIHNGWIRKTRRKGKDYELTSKANNFIFKYKIYGFLDAGNPNIKLLNPVMIKKGKSWANRNI